MVVLTLLAWVALVVLFISLVLFILVLVHLLCRFVLLLLIFLLLLCGGVVLIPSLSFYRFAVCSCLFLCLVRGCISLRRHALRVFSSAGFYVGAGGSSSAI